MGTFTDVVGGTWAGTNGFRMYPDDSFATAPSTAEVTPVAGGVGTAVAYTWVHPTDGEQHGFLLVGEPDQHGAVTACLLDSWHQRTGPALLTGTLRGTRVHVEYDYGSGWLWRVLVEPVVDGLAMAMWNVVPETGDGPPAADYEVMVARWYRSST